MISVEQHLARILDAMPSPTSELVDASRGVADLVGRATAEDVRAQVRLPGFTNSAMDGYAVRLADVEVGQPMPVSGDIPAGDTRLLSLEPGCAWRIMTGAPVPEGCDSVIPVEQSDGGVEQVVFDSLVEHRRHLRYAGEDVEVGDVVVPAGTRLTPHHVAVLVSSGVTALRVYERPGVAVVSTGDELVPLGATLQHGQIHDSNGPMLAAAVHAAGAELAGVHHVEDDEVAVTALFTRLLDDERVEVIVTTGGVSAGAFDVVKGALLEAGEVTFDKVAMQPGKPQGFGLLGERRVPVFTLPGNPMSTLVSFHVFVLPALCALAGRAQPTVLRGVAAAGWRTPPARAQYARVRVVQGPDGRLVITPNERQGSHHLGELAWANALAVVPADVAEVTAGDELDVMMLLEGV